MVCTSVLSFSLATDTLSRTEKVWLCRHTCISLICHGTLFFTAKGHIHVQLIFAAQKSDMWLAVDSVSGTKLHTYTSGGDISSTCPFAAVNGPVVHIARTGSHSQ